MKNCPYCAEEIQDAAIRCRWCQSELIDRATAAQVSVVPGRGGAASQGGGLQRSAAGPASPGLSTAPGSGMAIAALVLGVIGFLIPVIFSVMAIIFGGLGISNANNRGASGKGLAIAGLVLGIVGLLVGLAVLSGNA